MILMNANRLMLWGLYLGFILLAISLILLFYIFRTKNKNIKEKLIKTSFITAFIILAIDGIFYLHNYKNELIMYPKKFEWYDIKTLILNTGTLENGDIIIKSRGKGLANSAGHIYIYYNGKFLSFNRQGKYNTEVMSFEDMLDNATARENDNRHPFKDKFVVLRSDKEVNIENQMEFIKNSGYLPYTPTPLQKDTKKYNCSTFIYRILENEGIVKKKKYISTMPYDFLNMKEFKQVKFDKIYPANKEDNEDFIEIFPLIDTFYQYDIKPYFVYKDGRIKLEDKSVDFLKILIDSKSIENQVMFEKYLK